MALAVGDRLMGSRIVAGIGIRAEAATRLGVSRGTLMRYETGAIRPDENLLSTARDVYGVSLDYLRDGVEGSEQEKLASRVARLLSKIDETEEIDVDMAARLRLVRLERGYPSGAKAAASLDFAQASYLAHENAGRRIPHERAALYALQFRVRPEFLLSGKGAIFPAPDDPVSSWSAQPSAIEGDDSEPSWRWLRKRADDKGLVCPVLIEKAGVLEMATEGPLSIPTIFLRKKLPSGPLYGIFRPDGRIWIVDPASTLGEVVELTGLGTRVSASKTESLPSDVLKQSMPPEDRIILGLFVGEIAFNSFQDS